MVGLSFRDPGIIVQYCLAVFAQRRTIMVEMRILERDQHRGHDLRSRDRGEVPYIAVCQGIA